MKMNLQINDAGDWRNIATFGPSEQLGVMQAAASLLRALHHPHTVMRIAEGAAPLLECRGPQYQWSTAIRR